MNVDPHDVWAIGGRMFALVGVVVYFILRHRKK